jgi:hypothetical protein
MKRLVASLLLTLSILSGCDRVGSYGASRSTSAEGGQYKLDLRKQIQEADEIAVSEHSFQIDFFDPKTLQIRQSGEIVYKRVVLTTAQREFFRSTIDSLDPRTQDMFPACLFQPHHRIDFFAGGKLASSMEICFECGQVEWNRSKSAPPWSLYAGLETFIESIGMQPKQDWMLKAAGTKS